MLSGAAPPDIHPRPPKTNVMRIAIVTPYSWTYPGGVNRHIESLAGELLLREHDVRVMAPWDPPDRKSRILHRAPAEPRKMPDYLVPLGRTVGFKANGAVSNVSLFPDAITGMRRELRAFAPDVVHAHEPPAAVLSWDACSYRGAPVVGTFHAYSTKALPNQVGVAGRRPAQVQPADLADRGLRGSRLDRQALVRRQLPDHPQRRRPLARSRGGSARG